MTDIKIGDRGKSKKAKVSREWAWSARPKCPKTAWDGFKHNFPSHRPGPQCFETCEFAEIFVDGATCTHCDKLDARTVTPTLLRGDAEWLKNAIYAIGHNPTTAGCRNRIIAALKEPV